LISQPSDSVDTIRGGSNAAPLSRAITLDAIASSKMGSFGYIGMNISGRIAIKTKSEKDHNMRKL